MADTLQTLVETLILNPGDRVLFRFPTDFDPDDLEAAGEIIERRWPGVPVLIVTGEIGVSVVRDA